MLRFIYIFSNNVFNIEVQQDRNKLSPFIRNKNILSNLETKLSHKEDIIIFNFLKFLGQNYSPFTIEQEFFVKEMIELIKKTDFVFYKKTKKSSLKKLKDFSIIPLVNKKIQSLIPNKILIKIDSITKNKVKVKCYLKIEKFLYDIPIDYEFLIPLENKELGKIDLLQKKSLINSLENIINKSIDNLEFLTFEELNRLNKLDFIEIIYKSSTDATSKNVSFASNAIFNLEVFDKNLLKDNDIDLYINILKNYLNNKNYVEYNGELILIDKNLIKELDNKTLLKVFTNNFNNKSIIQFINNLVNIKSKITTKEILEKLKKSTFKASLKPHQEEGVKWLYNLYLNNIEGGLLADEMGLGKTIQVITFLILAKTKKNLIICPASLVHNWKNEILKFTDIKEKDISLEIQENSYITILSYESARSKIDKLSKIEYDVLVLDESQKIKNQSTQIFEAIKKIKRNFTIIMTGTPIENSLNDLWNMLFAINKNLYELYNLKIKPLINDKNYSKAIELTIKMLYPIMLQRKKEQVLNLPNRKNIDIFIEFSQEEQKEYDRLVKIFISAIKSGLSGRIQSIALEGLLRLRQFCSIHQILPSSLLNNHSLKDSKLEKTLDITKKIIKSNKKIVIFSQFTKSLDVLEAKFKNLNLNFVRLDGSVTKKQREKIIFDFQNNKNIHIFLISLKAGGVGLNLTAANTALLLEPWWNPAVEEQAFARIDRIGQKQETTIYRLFYKKSVEEKIYKLLEEKRNLFTDMSNNLINVKNIEMEIAKDVFGI